MFKETRSGELSMKVSFIEVHLFEVSDTVYWKLAKLGRRLWDALQSYLPSVSFKVTSNLLFFCQSPLKPIECIDDAFTLFYDQNYEYDGDGENEELVSETIDVCIKYREPYPIAVLSYHIDEMAQLGLIVISLAVSNQRHIFDKLGLGDIYDEAIELGFQLLLEVVEDGGY